MQMFGFELVLVSAFCAFVGFVLGVEWGRKVERRAAEGTRARRALFGDRKSL